MEINEEKLNECVKCCKGYFKILAGALLVVLIVFVGAKAKNEIENKAKVSDTIHTISVSGDGKIYAKPDIGQISLGVTNEAKTVAEAQKQSTDAINKIVDFLKGAGVEDKDISTTNYNINPVYDYTKNGQVLRGYQVSQNIQVKIRDLTKSGNIIAGAAENGANVAGGLNFTIDDPDALKAEAQKQAIDKAEAKAKELASNLGVKLGKLINFSESGYIPPIYYAKSAEAMGMGGGSTAPSIPTGENEITSTVSLTYEIDD